MNIGFKVIWQQTTYIYRYNLDMRKITNWDQSVHKGIKFFSLIIITNLNPISQVANKEPFTCSFIFINNAIVQNIDTFKQRTLWYIW